VAFDENVATTAMYPVMGNPMRAVMRRTIPAARGPDVAIAIPAMVTVDPDEFSTGTRTAGFNDRRGWSHLNIYLRKRGDRGERSCEH
jgi:hypothetical protein